MCSIAAFARRQDGSIYCDLGLQMHVAKPPADIKMAKSGHIGVLNAYELLHALQLYRYLSLYNIIQYFTRPVHLHVLVQFCCFFIQRSARF